MSTVWRTETWKCKLCGQRFKYGTHHPHGDREILLHLYGYHCLSHIGCGELLRCTGQTVANHLGKHNIASRTLTEAKRLVGLDVLLNQGGK